MKTTPKLRALIARLLIAATTSTCLSPHAHGGVISTEAALAPDRERILVLLDRPDVSAQLEAYGVKPTDAKARIAALSDAEVAELGARIDSAPAGAGGGQGLLLLPFVLLVIALAPFVLLAAGVTGVVKLASLAGNTANGQ